MTTRINQIAGIVNLLTNYKTETYLTVGNVNEVDSSSTRLYIYPKQAYNGDFVMDEESFMIEIQATSLANLETALSLIRSLSSGHETTGYGKKAMSIATRTADDSAFVGTYDTSDSTLNTITQAVVYASFTKEYFADPFPGYVKYYNMSLFRFNALGFFTSLTISSPIIKITAQANATITTSTTIQAYGHAGTSYNTLLDYEGQAAWNTIYIHGSSISALLANAQYNFDTTVEGSIDLGVITDFFINFTHTSYENISTFPLYRTGITLDGSVSFTASELPFHLEFKTIDKDIRTFQGFIECKARWAL
jgi:hypothetical protein